MNRRLLSLLVVTAMLFTAGCGKYADEGNKGTTAASSNSSSGSSNSSAASGSGSGTSSSSSTGSSNTASNASAAKNDPAKPAEKVKLGPLKVGEFAKMGPLTVTLKQVAPVDKAPGLPPGYIHLMTELSIANEGAAVYTVNITDHFKVETPEGKRAPYNIQATASRQPRLQGSLQQGQNVSGWIGFLSKRVNGTYKFMFIHPDYGEATWEFGL